jgi:hypothetical protein
MNMKRGAHHTLHKPPLSDRAAARRLLSILKSTGSKQAMKIKKIRRSVRQKTYENDLKLAIAVDRMVRQMAG